MKKMIKSIIKLCIVCTLLVVISIIAINFYVLSFSGKNYFRELELLPNSEYGLVFGASVNKDGTPSLILQDRLDAALESYKNGKIQKFIVSGFVSDDGYNEPAGMKEYLQNAGISEEHIIIDTQGIDTYNSLLQAKKIIGNKNITLFTQDFHLQRAIYIADRLAIDFSGMETNLREYKKENYFRELGARIKAFWEADILRFFG